jgi:hypothetical protein
MNVLDVHFIVNWNECGNDFPGDMTWSSFSLEAWFLSHAGGYSHRRSLLGTLCILPELLRLRACGWSRSRRELGPKCTPKWIMVALSVDLPSENLRILVCLNVWACWLFWKVKGDAFFFSLLVMLAYEAFCPIKARCLYLRRWCVVLPHGFCFGTPPLHQT